MNIIKSFLFLILVTYPHSSYSQRLLSGHHVPKVVSGHNGPDYMWMSGTYKLLPSDENKPSVYISLHTLKVMGDTNTYKYNYIIFFFNPDLADTNSIILLSIGKGTFYNNILILESELAKDVMALQFCLLNGDYSLKVLSGYSFLLNKSFQNYQGCHSEKIILYFQNQLDSIWKQNSNTLPIQKDHKDSLQSGCYYSENNFNLQIDSNGQYIYKYGDDFTISEGNWKYRSLFSDDPKYNYIQLVDGVTENDYSFVTEEKGFITSTALPGIYPGFILKRKKSD